MLRKLPFMRPLAALIAGILLQWYHPFPISVLGILPSGCLIFSSVFFFLPSAKKFSLQWLEGFAILGFIVFAGAMLVHTKDIRNNKGDYSLVYKKGDAIKITLLEPPAARPKSFKAIASVNGILANGQWLATTGKILVYFKNDSSIKNLAYGSQVVFMQPLENITNAGNPGEFDYKQYCLFHGIQKQIFLSSKNYLLLPATKTNWLKSFLFSSRNYILQTLRQNIPGQKELAVAEALLIGYRDDVDKNLLEAYNNTGVVHIIVISGLHMGMIYGLAVWLISFFKRKKWHRFVRPFFVLLVIWLFAFVTGARPSILRVATMLTFIVIGEALQRKHNVYNTLAASAFCLLVFNPFYLWDPGFQLSFTAVAGIVTFYKPVYHWLYFKNKILNKIWQLASVTITVQFLTIPLTILYYHRFPLFFLFTNFVAVPLACLCLYMELLLLAVAKWNWLTAILGKSIAACIWVVNTFIENTNRLPFSSVVNVYANIPQTLVLFSCIIAFATWLIQKNTKWFVAGLAFLCVFIAVKTATNIYDKDQKKLIVYNIPKHAAIDIFEKNYYTPVKNDSAENLSLRGFYFTPARIFFRANDTGIISSVQINDNVISSAEKNIFILNKHLPALKLHEKISVDAIIISQSPHIKIGDIIGVFDFKEIVFDSSNPLWKIALWRKDCESLHLRFHSVPEDGAFVMDL